MPVCGDSPSLSFCFFSLSSLLPAIMNGILDNEKYFIFGALLDAFFKVSQYNAK